MPSAVLLFYWLFATLVNGLVLMFSAKPVSWWQAAVFGNGVAVLALEGTAVPRPPASAADMDRSPVDTADAFSRLTFAWLNPLLQSSHDGAAVDDDDLPRLPTSARTRAAGQRFHGFWRTQLNDRKSPLLVVALSRAFGGQFAAGGCFKLAHDVLSLAQPQLLRLFIRFVGEYSQGDREVPLKKGVAIALVMFGVALVQTACLHQYFDRVFGVGMKIKSALTTAIYQKALVLSAEERATRSTSDMVSLMSVDTQRLQDWTQYGQTLWSGPFCVGVCLVSLHGLLGNSMWAGVAVMLVMVPVNAFVARYQKKLQAAQTRFKDMRMRFTSELFANMLAVKLYAWEALFVDRINEVRNTQELPNLRVMGVFMSIINFLWSSTPFLVSCTTFAVYVYTNDAPLTPDKVFPALALFNLLSFPLAVVPMVITSMSEATAAVSRLTAFFTLGEVQPDAVFHLEKATTRGDPTVIVQNATFLWSKKTAYKVALANTDFMAGKGELACIVGKHGAGKSALLQGMLGELHKSEGTVTIKGRVAYVPQSPWITNATVRDNILFGSKFELGFYNRTIEACAMVDDLAGLPNGDETQVGAKGYALTTAQKARLALARAVYARADVYILDDCLSAIDIQRRTHIIEQVLGEFGLLATKTRVLATNALEGLGHANSIALIANTTIVESGTYDQVVSAKNEIYKLVKDVGKASYEEPRTRRDSHHTLRRASTASFTATKVPDAAPPHQERPEQPSAHFAAYWAYAKSCDPYALFIYFLFLLSYSGLSVAAGFWLKRWSEHNGSHPDQTHVGKYLGVYVALCGGAAGSSVLYTLTLWVGCAVYAAKTLHARMLKRVASAPLSFFESTPLARITTRFAADIYKLDSILHRVLSQFCSNSITVLATLAVVSYTTPLFALLFIPPLAVLYVWYQRQYLSVSRALKRLDSRQSKQPHPVYAHFVETLGGLSTVRAFRQQERFSARNEAAVDAGLGVYWPLVSANRWLAVRLEAMGAAAVLGAAGLALFSLATASFGGGGRITAGAVGLALTYALQVTPALNWTVRMAVEAETNIRSVERILEFCELPTEPDVGTGQPLPLANWPPSTGTVEFRDYSAAGVQNVSLTISPNERVGVVGPGASALGLALFRLLEAPASGSVLVGGVDIATVPVHALRRGLAVVPPDAAAVIRTGGGTVRGVLDPEGSYTDTEMWRVLGQTGLAEHVRASSGGLDARPKFSAGQNRLVALARALLSPSPVVVVFEPTDTTDDEETNGMVRKVMREEFRNTTVMVIAPQPQETVLDCDRVAVLGVPSFSFSDYESELDYDEDPPATTIVEVGPPEELVRDRTTLFHALVTGGGGGDGEWPKQPW